MKPFFSTVILNTATIIFSGLCWYLSHGLTGDYWYLLWLAPIPVLILSFQSKAGTAFFISFIAYLIGRLSWFSYLESVATIVPATIFTLMLPLVFALVVILARRTVIGTTHWWPAFAFPVFWTSFELLLFKFSADGTAGSIAYSQLNMLPLIQVASVTGVLGISFIVTFIPSAVATCWYYRKQKNKLKYLAITSVAIVAAVFIFGAIRISGDANKNTVKVGLIVLEENLHNITDHPDAQKEILLSKHYAEAITTLAAKGPQLIVLPERAINITKETDSAVMNILSAAAKQNHIVLVAGYTNFKEEPARNSAMVINADGLLGTSYNKVHLVTGLENQFTPGNEIGLFKFNGIQAGVAVCKDLDFPDYIKKYGDNNVSFLYIPAWDFVTDDWLHARMAVLRGVENGFSEIRAARQGRLTISDYYGRINFEASSAAGNAVTLTGEVSLENSKTFYSRFGNWFGILNLIAAGFFIFLTKKKIKA